MLQPGDRLTLHRSKIDFRPTQGKNGKGADYRVLAGGKPRKVELGGAPESAPAKPDGNFCPSAWTTDGSALSHPLSAAFEEGRGVILVWSRRAKRQAEAA
jgi:hypothetical protein